MIKRGEISVKKTLWLFVVFVALLLIFNIISIFMAAGNTAYFSPSKRLDSSGNFFYYFIVFVLFMLIVLFVYKLVKTEKSRIEE